jgi:hypothetical protein
MNVLLLFRCSILCRYVILGLFCDSPISLVFHPSLKLPDAVLGGTCEVTTLFYFQVTRSTRVSMSIQMSNS